jgi:glycosyltransferase involved in cell wall biosynthesis
MFMESKILISLCMIVKNERANLGRCLASAQPHVDEIIVVDTGSRDNTVEIAKTYGSRIKFFEWCDDFAAARNYSIAQATGEWILQLDADEELIVIGSNWRQKLQAQTEILAYSIDRFDVGSDQSEFIGGYYLRLFRNLPEFKYHGRYHEHLRYGDSLKLLHLSELQILHHGNSQPEQLITKIINRDIPILERIRREDGLSFWLLDCLAKNYLHIGNLDHAHNCYREASDRLFPNLLSGEKPEDTYWVPTLIHFLAQQALENQDFETGRLLCQRGLEWFPNHVPLLFLTGELFLDLGFPLGAIAYFEQCLKLGQTHRFYQGEPLEKSLLTVEPACALGRAYAAMAATDQAIAAYQLALSMDNNCEAAQIGLAELSNPV